MTPIDAIASALHSVRPIAIAAPLQAQFQHKADCEAVADAIEKITSEFDRRKFLEACGWKDDALIR